MPHKVHAAEPPTIPGSAPSTPTPVPRPSVPSTNLLHAMARQSTSMFPDNPVGGSAGSIPPVASRLKAQPSMQLQRSSSISQGLLAKRKTTIRNTGEAIMEAAGAATATALGSVRQSTARVRPADPAGSSPTNASASTTTLKHKRSSIDSGRDSSASRTKALSEFNIFLKIMDEVAIHIVTLYFINITSSAVITKMEQSFTKYYANSQQRLYLRGLTALIVFMIATFAYDYVVLWKNLDFSSSIKPTSSTPYVGNTKLPKFTLVVGLKVAIVLPVIFLTYFRARKHSYAEDLWLTWICIAIVAAYPLAYNKLTNDYGVSWVCLVIMYIYSCTPIRFFPSSVFCLGYLVVYVIVMLAYIPAEPASSSSSSSNAATRERVSSETLYACLFCLLILLPSQSREYAIRVSYMSELMVLLQQEQLKMEEGRSKALLNSMLPQSIVVQLQSGRELIADAYADATVLFAEVCDFDYYSSKLKPQHVVELLNILFYKFDKLVDVHHVHKVETIGAVYMVVGGCPDPISNHAEFVANLALDMIRCMPEVSEKIARKPWGSTVKALNIRIGINSGGLMAGVVGIRNPRFKLFGDTVNVASRMETTNLPGQIQMTEATYNVLKENYFTALRGKVFVKGRGELNTYFLKGRGSFLVPPPPAVVAVAPAAGALGPVPAATTAGPAVATVVVAQQPTGASLAASASTTTTTTTTSVSDAVTALGVSPPRPQRMSIVRHTRRQNSNGVAPSQHQQHQHQQSVGSLTSSSQKQNSLAELLATATPSSASPLNLDGSLSLMRHLTLQKANELVTATITSTPSSSASASAANNKTPSVLSIDQRRQTLTQIRRASLRNIATASQKRSVVRENIFDIVEEADEFRAAETSAVVSSSSSSKAGGGANTDPTNTTLGNAEIMKLPKGLTRFEVLFRVHGRTNTTFSPDFRPSHKDGSSGSGLSREAYEFEESYRLENRGRWLRFFRLSILVFLILKPFMTMYQILRLTSARSFAESHVIFVLNFCVMYPLGILYLLYTFSPNFMDFEQSTSILIVLVIALTLNAESVAANSLGHAYMSVIALYQCYFANVSFLLRVFCGFMILALYLLTNLVIAPFFGWNSDTDQLRVGRNALYIFIFFGGQAWVVFNSEFKQRINHYREITLNSQKQKLVEEEARITKLLLNLLPETIVHKLKEDPETTIADFFDNVTVLFTDMVNFTAYSSKVSAMELVQFLNDMYTRFDTIAEKENLYKVEIIGDAYFVVGGCPIVSHNNALAVVTAATEMFAVLPNLRRNCGVPDLNIRIGIHSGPVLAGVVGSKDPRYHLFGETVTIAHSLESSGVPGRIHISEATWARMNKDTPVHGFKVEYHTLLSIHGYAKKIRTYFVQ